jgi:hypothetical protein
MPSSTNKLLVVVATNGLCFPTVLVVEDEFLVRLTIVQYLREHGAPFSKPRLPSGPLRCAGLPRTSIYCSPT